jgi:hypothetical protein
LHQTSDKRPVAISSRDIPVGIVRGVVQGHVPRIRMKDSDNLGFRVPVSDVGLR